MSSQQSTTITDLNIDIGEMPAASDSQVNSGFSPPPPHPSSSSSTRPLSSASAFNRRNYNDSHPDRIDARSKQLRRMAKVRPNKKNGPFAIRECLQNAALAHLETIRIASNREINNVQFLPVRQPPMTGSTANSLPTAVVRPLMRPDMTHARCQNVPTAIVRPTIRVQPQL